MDDIISINDRATMDELYDLCENLCNSVSILKTYDNDDCIIKIYSKIYKSDTCCELFEHIYVIHHLYVMTHDVMNSITSEYITCI